jgi:TfoX/Sxy family transcriptional regulator of competence genes
MKNNSNMPTRSRTSNAFEHVASILRKEGLVDVASTVASVQRRRAFGVDALKINGKIFAMPVAGTMVIKLPRERVTTLVESGEGSYYDPGHGRLMREWISLRAPDKAIMTSWLDLAREAQEFVKTSGKTTNRKR